MTQGVAKSLTHSAAARRFWSFSCVSSTSKRPYKRRKLAASCIECWAGRKARAGIVRKTAKIARCKGWECCWCLPQSQSAHGLSLKLSDRRACCGVQLRPHPPSTQTKLSPTNHSVLSMLTRDMATSPLTSFQPSKIHHLLRNLRHSKNAQSWEQVEKSVEVDPRVRTDLKVV